MRNNFDFTSSFYDRIVQLVFGNKLWKAKRVHLRQIQPKDSVLIVGGGTGDFLDWLPADCEITYVELSTKMIERAKRRRNAQFIHADYLSFTTEQRFDWVISAFFLDCFSEPSLKRVLEKIQEQLAESGGLILVDFKTERLFHRVLIKVMILFFRLTARLEAKKLPAIRKLVMKNNFELIHSYEFQKGLIFSDLYKKGKPFDQ